MNSHNDFDPLEEIIVGHPVHLAYPDDVSMRLFFRVYDWSAPGVGTLDGPTDLSRLREELLEDHAELVGTLQSMGIVVRQPDLWSRPRRIVTPDWESETGHNTMVRDLALVLGDEIIETPPLVRSRYFEGHVYKRIFMDYFARGARWTVAPRPRMLAESFDYGFAVKRGWPDPVPERVEPEIMFDAPQILRLGRDLFFNCSTENHFLGARWLERHLQERYRVHPLITGVDDHIDCVLIALRPGTLLLHERLDPATLPEPLRNWKVIRYKPEGAARPTFGVPQLASPGVEMNVLSIDHERVVVDADETGLIRLLERHGFTPIPCRWRHGRLVGGGAHCMTLDVRRRGECEDYTS